MDGHAYISVAVLLLGTFSLINGLADNLGTEFVVVFMRNEVETPLDFHLELTITTPRTIPVQVRVSTQRFTDSPIDVTTTVVSGLVEKIELSHLLRLSGVGIENKVVYIHADNEIVVYGLNKEKFSADGFLVYPTDVIGYEYYTVSYSPASSYSVFAIASKYANTHVSITFPSRQNGNPIRVHYRGQMYSNNDILNITLDAFQSFQCLSEDHADLTGTHIITSMPVAVFSGNDRTWVGSQTSRDHLVVQLPPVQAFGKLYPIIPSPERTIGDVIRVISSQPNTRIFVEGPPPRYFNLPRAGYYVDFDIPSNRSSRVSSESPILVVQIVKSQQSTSELTDPTMSVVTATSQYLADYIFSTPQYRTGSSYDNWLMLSVKNEEISGLMFDNRPIAELDPEWTPIPGSVLMGTQVRIEAGAHVIRHVSPTARFSGYLYGVADKESYSFQIGTRMSRINQPCIPTDAVFGDGVDNDCDGNIDEELCTGTNMNTDTDLDGEVDEDCSINRDIGAGVPDSGGRQFVIFFMDNVVEAPRFLSLEVYVTPLRDPQTTVQIESPNWFEPTIYQRARVTFGRMYTFFIPYTMREVGTGMTSKALFITADHDIAVYAVNKERYSADTFLALPIDVLGKEYYTITHYPNSDSSMCQIGVIGISDGTQVEITFPPVRTSIPLVQVIFHDRIYTNGDTLSVAMNRYSTLQLQTKGDLSGTRVKSTQRVAVLSGNIRTSIGSGSSRDHLVAMLPPTESWGKSYCTVPIPGRTTGDYFYILAAENDTEVEVLSKQQFMLDAGESRQLILSSLEYRAIQSNKPILVAQMSQSQQSKHEIGDPTMILLPSVKQWANAYTFSTTTNTHNTLLEYQNFVVLVCDVRQVHGLIFDGEYIPELFTTWYTVTGTNYTGTSFLIDNGIHTVQHMDPTVTFSVVVYGNADKESYGFAAGMRLARINARCEVTEGVEGDGIDNDCDGRIDEEMCEGGGSGSDTDGDGSVDEDCAVYIPVPDTVTQPSTTPDIDNSPTTPLNRVQSIIGPAGPPGVQGPPGASGAPGVSGNNGIPGIPGHNGRDGSDGTEGRLGAPGEIGATGNTGSTGAIGMTGSTGATGVRGPQGDAGSQGGQGIKGEPGVSIKGDNGATGDTGDTGSTGVSGIAGANGATGAQGLPGQRGEDGVTGAKGSQGFKGDMGPNYEDENECLSEDNPCSDICINVIGSFYCSCLNGFQLDSTLYRCVDLDECVEYNGGCVDTCVNTVGGFHCVCSKTGYTLANDNKTCIDIDECSASRRPCSDDERCINTVGSFVCMSVSLPSSAKLSALPLVELRVCSDGKELDADTGLCTDVDECNLNNGGCAESCKNLVGSFYCSCPTGYRLAQDGRSCIDVDECSVGYDDCLNSEICINSVGSFHCISPTDCGGRTTLAQRSSGLGSVDTSTLVNGDLLLVLLIWSTVITVLFLVLAVCFCKQCRDQNWDKRSHLLDMQDIRSRLHNSYRVLSRSSSSADR